MSSFTDPGDTAMAEEDAQVVGSDAVDMDLAALQAQQFQTSPFLEPPCPGEHPPVTPHTPAVLPGITKGPTTMENRSQSDEQMALALSAISSPTSSPFSRCKIIAIEYPPELVFGLNETARFCVHQNLVTNETMDDSDSGPWDENLVLHVRFLNVSSDSNSALPERALSVNSKLDPSWESDGRFKYDVEIRYRRRTEGESLSSGVHCCRT